MLIEEPDDRSQSGFSTTKDSLRLSFAFRTWDGLLWDLNPPAVVEEVFLRAFTDFNLPPIGKETFLRAVASLHL